MDQHDIICALKDLAIELGRTPTRKEFVQKYKFGDNSCRKFGWNILLKAAELEPLYHKLKVTNEIFEINIEESLKEYVPAEQLPRINYTPTLVIGDAHFPFVSESTLEFIYKFAQKNKPKRIVQVGDLYDMYAHSKFPRSQNIYTPDQEEDLGREGAEKMWKTLKSIVPDAECVQLLGNHDVRPVKRTMELNPVSERAVKYWLEKVMTFEGVKTIQDPRQEYIVEGIEFIHGYKSKIGDHRDYALMNAVCGHIHRGGVMFRRIRGQTLWELNAGFIGDPDSKVFGYTPQKIKDYTLGLGWIDEYGPRFIAL